MVNIFKTTLKKDIIADIANNNKREVRFPITKFWATRFADEYNLDERTFVFKTFDSLEFSSPSNKETGGDIYTFDFDRIFVEGDEFVVVFKEHLNEEVEVEKCEIEDIQPVIINDVVVNIVTTEDVIDDIPESNETFIVEDNNGSSDGVDDEISLQISNEDVFDLLTQWLEDEKVLDNFYYSDSVFATNAKQIIVLSKGKVLGFKKTLPVNNDAEVRIEFDTNEKIYFDSILDFDHFEDEILNTLNEIRKNNFVFVWKRYTGIFMDDNGIYFGIKYSTRKSIGFDRKYNIQ